jgi:hypothetical protein
VEIAGIVTICRADITDPEAPAEVRRFKQEQKAAAKQTAAS